MVAAEPGRTATEKRVGGVEKRVLVRIGPSAAGAGSFWPAARMADRSRHGMVGLTPPSPGDVPHRAPRGWPVRIRAVTAKVSPSSPPAAETDPTRPAWQRSGAETAKPRGGASACLVLAVVLAGAAGLLALWWRHRPEVIGLGAWLTEAGRVTGLLAGYAAAVLVALMARIPLLENGIGAGWLARWHALGGRWTVALISAHVSLIIWGYSVSDGTDAVSEAKTLVADYPDMLSATAGFLLFLAVGLVSVRAVWRWVGHETWRGLHLTVYLAIALAFGHQLSTGGLFADSRLARAGWLVLYLALAATVIWFRLFTPAYNALIHKKQT